MFKNITAFQFNKPFTTDQDTLEVALSEFQFTPCGSQDVSKFGFTPAFGKLGKTLVHSADGFLMVAVTTESKIIPANSVREALDEKVAAIELAEGRKVPKKEKDAIKDEVIQEMLPRALTRKSVTKAIIVLGLQLIIVDSSSLAKAEELLALLRKALGSLPVVQLTFEKPIESTLTEWLKAGAAPLPFEIQDEADLKSEADDGGTVRFKQQDLSEEEVLAHLVTGKQAHKIALHYGNSIAFNLHSNAAIKRIKFAEEFKALNDDVGTEDPAARLDADFALYTEALADLMKSLNSVLGGKDE